MIIHFYLLAFAIFISLFSPFFNIILVPKVKLNSCAFLQAGYVGEDVESILYKLLAVWFLAYKLDLLILFTPCL